MIEVKDMTVKYRNGKGVFDIGFLVPEGSAAGYIGPNGAGKSTTIRALMGFLPTDRGVCRIDGMDCFVKSAQIKKKVGYIPGEIVFPDGMKCLEFLKYQCELRGMKEESRMKALIERFELDTRGTIKEFSKGMKQKVGIVAAFMHDPEILILDEPTSGLDPLMQNEFVSLILEEKKRGKTILMSSHIFEEVEKTCDEILFIKEGRLLAGGEVEKLRKEQVKRYVIKTDEPEKLERLGLTIGKKLPDGAEILVHPDELDAFIRGIGSLHIQELGVREAGLEDLFMNYYRTEE